MAIGVKKKKQRNYTFNLICRSQYLGNFPIQFIRAKTATDYLTSVFRLYKMTFTSRFSDPWSNFCLNVTLLNLFGSHLAIQSHLKVNWWNLFSDGVKECELWPSANATNRAEGHISPSIQTRGTQRRQQDMLWLYQAAQETPISTNPWLTLNNSNLSASPATHWLSGLSYGSTLRRSKMWTTCGILTMQKRKAL